MRAKVRTWKLRKEEARLKHMTRVSAKTQPRTFRILSALGFALQERQPT